MFVAFNQHNLVLVAEVQRLHQLTITRCVHIGVVVSWQLRAASTMRTILELHNGSLDLGRPRYCVEDGLLAPAVERSRRILIMLYGESGAAISCVHALDYLAFGHRIIAPNLLVSKVLHGG